MAEALYAAAWIAGEYTETCSNPVHVISSLLVSDTLNLPEHIQALYLSAVLKLLALCGATGSRSGNPALQEAVAVIKRQLPYYTSSLFIEVQERACFLEGIIGLIEVRRLLGESTDVGGAEDAIGCWRMLEEANERMLEEEVNGC